MTKIRWSVATVAILLFGLGSTAAFAQLASEKPLVFTAKPNKCIALHKGQTCYQKIKFSWGALGQGEYCLYQLSSKQALTCWTNNTRRQFAFEFASADSQEFEIRREDKGVNLAQVKVIIAWVYKTRRKSSSSWRLF